MVLRGVAGVEGFDVAVQRWLVAAQGAQAGDDAWSGAVDEHRVTVAGGMDHSASTAEADRAVAGLDG